MKKNIKSCLSLLLAVTLVAASTLYTRDTSLKATNDEPTQEVQVLAEEITEDGDAALEDETEDTVEIVLPTESEDVESTEEIETPAVPEEETQAPDKAEGETQTPAVPEEETQTPDKAEGETQTPAVPEEETQAPDKAEGETQTPVLPEGETQTPAVPEEETQTPAIPEGETQLPEGTEAIPLIPLVPATPEVLFPEFHTRQSVGGVTVSLEAEQGVLPEGTTATVTHVSSDEVIPAIEKSTEQSVVDAAAFDITLFDKEGNAVQPTGSVTLTFDGISVKGDKIAVCHISDSGKIDVIKEMDENSSSIEVTADSFSTYAVYGLTEKATLGKVDISDEDHVMRVDEWIQLAGSEIEHGFYQWRYKSINGGRITLHDNGKDAQIIATQPGEVIIYHDCYEKNDWSKPRIEEEFKVKILPASDIPHPESSQRVYVYVKLQVGDQVDTSDGDWKLNGSGWYTIGYLDVEGMPSAQSAEATPELSEKVISALSNKKVQYYSGNEAVSDGVNLCHDVDWVSEGFGLRIADGADDYVPHGQRIWHLDGLLTIDNREEHTVTVHYVYEDGSKAHESITKTGLTGAQITIPSPIIEGYTPNREVVDVIILNEDREFTVVYKANKPVDPSQIKLVVTADSASKVYDGTPLTKPTFTHTGSLKQGDKIEATVTGSITNVGRADNIISSVKIMRGAQDVTNEYEIKRVSGELMILPPKLVITADSASKVYDGTPLTKATFTHKGTLKQGDKITAVVTGSITDVGTAQNVISNVKVMRGDKDVTKEYDIEIVSGELTILPPELEVTADSASKEYDGTPLTKDSFTHKGSLKEGDRIEAVVTGSITNAGTGNNVISNIKVMRGDKDVTSEYNIKPVNGTLTVNKKPITFTGNSESKIYNGAVQSITGFTAEGLLDGHTSNANAAASGKDAGEYPGVLNNVSIFDAAGRNVTQNYDITTIPGKLTILPQTELTVTAGSESKEYDGTPLTKDSFTHTGSLKEGDRIEAVVTGSITNAGTAENALTEIKVMRGDKDVTSEYKITAEKGALTINKKPITFTGNSASERYNGEEHTVTGYTVEGLLDGHVVESVSASASATEAGEYIGTITEAKNVYIFNAAGGNVTKNYDITTVPGKLTILPQTELVITAGSASKEYDGTELTESNFTYEGVLENGDKIEAVVTGSITDAGTVENVLSEIKVMRGDKDVTGEYNIKPVNGTLTIDKKSVAFIGNSDSKVYNGKEQSVTGFTAEGLLAGHTSNVSASASGTEAKEHLGTITAKEDVVILDGSQQVVTQNYNIQTIPGKLMITEGVSYVLTIHYVDEQGNHVAPDYIKSYAQGEQFSVVSPEVEGYVANYASIRSDENGMPAKDLEFTVTYSKAQIDGTPVNPSRPTDPDEPSRPERPERPDRPRTPVEPAEPEQPAAPEAVTPAAPEEAAAPIVPEVQEPVDVVVTEDENGDYVLRTVEETKTPLANKNLGDHSCCILHFLLMLLALLVMIFHTHSMKKHQAKIFELRETLKFERLKRGLDTEDEDLK